MFLLVSQEVQTLKFGEGEVRYREATASEYSAILRDPRFANQVTGATDHVAAENALVRQKLVGWELKTSSGDAIAFSPENIDFVLSNATPHGLQQLRSAVLGMVRESAESGKD